MISLSQGVNQILLPEPLIPPQLTVKDFYMTGEVLLAQNSEPVSV